MAGFWRYAKGGSCLEYVPDPQHAVYRFLELLMSDHFVRLAQVFRETRLERKLSQEYLAQAAGISLRTLQRAEREGVMSAETAKALGAVLSIDTDQPLPQPVMLDAPVAFVPATYRDLLKKTFPVDREVYLFISFLYLFLPGLMLLAGLFRGFDGFSWENFWQLTFVWTLFGSIFVLWEFSDSFSKNVALNQKRRRVSKAQPFWHHTLADMQEALQDPALSFQQAQKILNEKMEALSENATMHLQEDDLSMQPLLYLQEDMKRGLSPRKTLGDYLRAQQGLIQAVFDPDRRLHKDLDAELDRLQRKVSLFA